MAFQWNPALLAREVATVDDLTGGRLELGLRTGYVQSEHDRAGLPFGAAGERGTISGTRWRRWTGCCPPRTMTAFTGVLAQRERYGFTYLTGAGGVHGDVRTAGRYRRSRRRRVSGWWNSGCRAVSRDGIAV